jgi:hypothetical protein
MPATLAETTKTQFFHDFKVCFGKRIHQSIARQLSYRLRGESMGSVPRCGKVFF